MPGKAVPSINAGARRTNKEHVHCRESDAPPEFGPALASPKVYSKRKQRTNKPKRPVSYPVCCKSCSVNARGMGTAPKCTYGTLTISLGEPAHGQSLFACLLTFSKEACLKPTSHINFDSRYLMGSVQGGMCVDKVFPRLPHLDSLESSLAPPAGPCPNSPSDSIRRSFILRCEQSE